jgi:hypothetical protein
MDLVIKDEDYLDAVISVYFKPYDQKRLYIIYDLESNVKYMSAKFNKYQTTSTELEVKLKDRLRISAMQDNDSVTYMSFLVRENEEHLCSVRIRPLMSQLGNVIGCVEYYESFNPTVFMMNNKLHSSGRNENLLISHEPSQIKQVLTLREIEILFLLMCNYSQHLIGEILAISRSTVKSAIENRIVPKINDLFKINTNSSLEVIDYLRQRGISVPFSSRLFQNKVIVLNNVLSDFD